MRFPSWVAVTDCFGSAIVSWPFRSHALSLHLAIPTCDLYNCRIGAVAA